MVPAMRFLKWLGISLGVLVLLVGGALGWLALMTPKSRPASTASVAVTPARVERGRYLFHHVVACSSCHTPSDYAAFAAPQRVELTGAGKCFPESFQLPGTICPPNITPHPGAGIGRWTDGELMRALREGVGRDGRALFMMERYPLSDEDASSLVAYLRSLPPLPQKQPRSQVSFPVNLLIKTSPAPLAGPIPHPAATSGAAYGEYLSSLAGCGGCHSSEELEFGGGEAFDSPAGKEVAPSIAGLPSYTPEAFVQMMKSYEAMEAAPVPAKLVMPWRAFAGMTEADLTSVHAFIRSRPARGSP